MDGPTRKRSKRFLLGSLALGAIILLLLLWAAIPSSTILHGDAGYLRMLRYKNYGDRLGSIYKALPGPLRPPIEKLRGTAEDRCDQQFENLLREHYITRLTIDYRLANFPFTNRFGYPVQKELHAEILRATPDPRFPPMNIIQSFRHSRFGFVCRTRDIPSYSEYFGRTNTSTIDPAFDIIL